MMNRNYLCSAVEKRASATSVFLFTGLISVEVLSVNFFDDSCSYMRATPFLAGVVGEQEVVHDDNTTSQHDCSAADYVSEDEFDPDNYGLAVNELSPTIVVRDSDEYALSVRYSSTIGYYLVLITIKQYTGSVGPVDSLLYDEVRESFWEASAVPTCPIHSRAACNCAVGGERPEEGERIPSVDNLERYIKRTEDKECKRIRAVLYKELCFVGGYFGDYLPLNLLYRDLYKNNIEALRQEPPSYERAVFLSNIEELIKFSSNSDGVLRLFNEVSTGVELYGFRVVLERRLKIPSTRGEPHLFESDVVDVTYMKQIEGLPETNPVLCIEESQFVEIRSPAFQSEPLSFLIKIIQSIIGNKEEEGVVYRYTLFIWNKPIEVLI